MAVNLLVVCVCIAEVHAAPQYNNPTTNPSWPSTRSYGNWGADYPILPPQYNKVRVAHAVLASVAWLIFFPLGSILIRSLETKKRVQIHYTLQMAGIYIFMAAAGMGIWMAKTSQVLNRYHPIIGLTLLVCISVQPLTELVSHFSYHSHPRIIYLGYFHIWFGRFVMTMGIIQGGLGFVFSASLPYATVDKAPRIAYGVVAIVVWVLYISLAIVYPEVKHTLGWWQRRHNRDVGREALRTRSLVDGAAISALDRRNVGRK